MITAWATRMKPKIPVTTRDQCSVTAPVLDRPVRDTALYLALAPPLEAGTAYFWFVDGLLEEGGAARSSVWRFSILE